MPTPTPQEVTRLLLAWSQGEQAALEQPVPLVYGELRQLEDEEAAEQEREGHGSIPPGPLMPAAAFKPRPIRHSSPPTGTPR